MKQNIASSNDLFVDRPLTSTALNTRTPSLWSISTSCADHADTALRFFLMLCLVSSLVLCGLKMSNSIDVVPSSDLGLSLKTFAVEPALSSVKFGVSIR